MEKSFRLIILTSTLVSLLVSLVVSVALYGSPSLGYVFTQPTLVMPPPPPPITQGKCNSSGQCSLSGTGISCTIGQDGPCGQTRCQGFAGARKCVLGSYDAETCDSDIDCNRGACCPQNSATGCIEVTESACTNNYQGKFLGYGECSVMDWGVNACQNFWQGACCIPAGLLQNQWNCSQIGETACGAYTNSQYIPGGSCSPNPCGGFIPPGN